MEFFGRNVRKIRRDIEINTNDLDAANLRRIVKVRAQPAEDTERACSAAAACPS
jgi:hypothetical protein